CVCGRVLAGRWIVERSPGDGAPEGTAGAMPVSEKRAAIRRVAGDAFRSGPTVVRSRNAVVDLFPGVFADVIDEDSSGAWLHGERERVAQPESPDRLVHAGR